MEYKLIKDQVKRRKAETYWNNFKFAKDCRTEFFNTESSPEQIKDQAKFCEVKMNSED